MVVAKVEPDAAFAVVAVVVPAPAVVDHSNDAVIAEASASVSAAFSCGVFEPRYGRVEPVPHPAAGTVDLVPTTGYELNVMLALGTCALSAALRERNCLKALVAASLVARMPMYPRLAL